MKKTMKAIFAALACAIFLAGCGDDETAKAPAKIEDYKTGEEIALKSVFGKNLTLKRVEGGFVIKGEEDKIFGQVTQEGLTLVVLALYLNDKNIVKARVALAKGKNLHDKRETIKRKEADKEARAAMKKYA